MQLLTQRFLMQLLSQLTNSPHAAGWRPIASRVCYRTRHTQDVVRARVFQTMVGRFRMPMRSQRATS
jgi:hypothetical protein